MKSQVTNLRKKIYKNLKQKAYSLESHSDELETYLKDQTSLANRPFKVIEIESIISQVKKSDVIFLGDFHTFDQNIRNVLRILKFLTEQDANTVIALEMIHAEFQIYIDAYMEHHLTDLEFLDSIKYHHSWRFPWTHYKLIFEIAKEKNLKVYGINTTGNLTTRDKFAAMKISEIKQENPNSQILSLYGELHITIDKIPKMLKEISPLISQTIIHQNLDEVYWELIKQKKEDGIVSFSANEFCIISAPPWIKYESMIYWYENLCDDPEFDIHEYIIENGKKFLSEETNETFYNLCMSFNQNFKLSFTKEEIEDFNLYDHSNLDYVQDLLTESIPRKYIRYYEYLFLNNKSFRFPQKNSFYCSSYSMNRIAYLAGIHLFYLKINQSLDAKKNSALNKKEDFLVISILESVYAYFFSKIINPHRKCNMYLDFKKSKETEYQTTVCFLEEKFSSSLVSSLSVEEVYEAALNTGHILGEYLYRDFISLDSKSVFYTIFNNIEITLSGFFKIRNLILKDVEFKKHQKSYF